jgi:hypothetical protein
LVLAIFTIVVGRIPFLVRIGPAARGSLIALMMEAAGTSETSVNFYQTTRYNNPEDSYLNTRRRENLTSHILMHDYMIGANMWKRLRGSG